MSINISTLNVYARVEPRFIGTITMSGGSLNFNQIDISVPENIIARFRESFSDGWKPTRIAGMRDVNGAMINFVYPISEDDPAYWARIIDQFRYEFPDYYFVFREEIVDWKNIEEEIGAILQSGALEEGERDTVLQALSRAGEEEILLIHFLLSRIQKGFVSVIRNTSDYRHNSMK